MNEVTTTKQDREVEYIPFGAQDKMRLSVALVTNFIAEKTKTGKTCSERDAIKFIMLCKARALNPWEGEAYLLGYDTQDGPKFSLITAHVAFLKRAEAHPNFKGMESGTIVRTKSGEIKMSKGDFTLDDETVVGGWAIVHRSDRDKPTERRVKFSTYNTGRSRWEKDPAGMIVKVAEADALRSAFPNSLAGMFIREEQDLVDGIQGSRQKVEVKTPLFTDTIRTKTEVVTVEPVDDDQIPGAEVPATPRRGRPRKTESPAQATSETVGVTKEDKGNSSELATPESEPPPRVINYASGLRKLLAIEKITEGEFLNYLNQTAKVTGLPTSLEDLVLSHPDVAKAAFEEWTQYLGEFQTWVESQEV